MTSHRGQQSDINQEFFDSFFSNNTRRAYRADLIDFEHYLNSFTNITKLTLVNRAVLENYRNYLLDKKVASATLHRRFVALRTFYRWCQETQKLEKNPCDHIRLPRYEVEQPTQALSDEEMKSMIESVDTSTQKGLCHRLILVLLAHLGLRRSELAQIKLKDFCFERNHKVLKILGKGQKRRRLPLSNSLYLEIYSYLTSLENQFGLALGPSDYLLQIHKGEKMSKPLDGSTIYRVIKKYAKLNGISKKISPHSLRATSISHLLDTQKTPIRDVAIFAGHSQITTTERYDKRRTNLDSSAAYKIDYETD